MLAEGLHIGMRRDAAPPHVPATWTHRGPYAPKYGAEPAPAASSADEGTTPKAAPKAATPFEASLEARTRREPDVVAAEVAFDAAVQEQDAEEKAYFDGLSKREKLAIARGHWQSSATCSAAIASLASSRRSTRWRQT